MFEKLKNKLKQIQESDEATKKKWLIIMTAVAMIIVISLWLVYINYSIKSVNDEAVAIKTEKLESETDFLEVFKKGLSVVGNSAKEKIKNWGYGIMDGKTIMIEK
ncbi:MAG: hypothetical protein AAB396_02210 [Patescibacteria group bacterium]